MEAEIVFCERCGVSIPEPDIAKSRQASGGKDLCPACLAPGSLADDPTAPGDLQLYFCENCRVSIAVSDVLTRQARPEGAGYLCAVCSRSTPAERVARRTAVEREMADAAPAPAPHPRSPATLYFCDGCNASIPASAVATGRALVEGGRTWCERCRPGAASASTRGPGAGFLPVAAAALLAAGVTAAGFVVWERSDRASRGTAVATGQQAEIDSLRQEVRAARQAADATRMESSDRLDRASRDWDRRMESLRAESREVRSAAEKAAAAVPAEGSGRLERIESRMADLEAEMGLGLQTLAERIERVSQRTAPEAPPAPAPSDGMPADGGGAASSPPPQARPDLSPEAKKNVALLKDKAAEARFAAAIELGKLGEKAVWPSLVEALKKDDDPFVRRACCRSLGELKAYEAFPDLVDTLADSEELIAKLAASVVKDMAAQDFGYKQGQPKGDRRKVMDRARKWWEENKARLVPAGG